MKTRTLFGIALAAMAGFTAAVPTIAQAHDDNGYHRGWYKHDRYRGGYEGRRYGERRYYSRCRTSGTTGLLVGAGAGALLGRAVDTRGDRAPGTIIGAAGGALLGREIDRNHRC